MFHFHSESSQVSLGPSVVPLSTTVRHWSSLLSCDCSSLPSLRPRPCVPRPGKKRTKALEHSLPLRVRTSDGRLHSLNLAVNRRGRVKSDFIFFYEVDTIYAQTKIEWNACVVNSVQTTEVPVTSKDDVLVFYNYHETFCDNPSFTWVPPPRCQT